MSYRTTSTAQSGHVTTCVARTNSRFSRNYSGLLASLGFAALLLVGAPALAATAPVFGTAQPFTVLGASAVTNTGLSVLTGELGIWPNNASSVTGFPPGTIIGATHFADAVALGAQTAVTTAYNNLATQPVNTDLTGQDLGGLTLTAGVYNFSSSAQLTGTLTLDAQNDPTAVFVFKMGSTLTTASNAVVSVIHGGSNCNVFWQVGSSATLGTGTTFAGNILALTSITVTTGANVSGRLLARNGAVTLDTNAVSNAGCNVTPPTLTATTISTQASAVQPGGAVFDTAVLGGGTGSPSGNIIYLLYGPNNATCSGPAAFTTTALVVGTGTYVSSPSFTPTAVGTYRWRAGYGGDSINAASVGACSDESESVTVTTVVATAATAIPTLSEWALIVLAAFMAITGFVAMRRKER